MKVAVISANGKVGKLITNGAVARGMDVTAIVRHENQTNAPHSLNKDLFDLTTDDLTPFDVVVDAFGVWEPKKLHEHQTSLKHLADILSGTKTKLFIVGGAGSLYVDAEHKTQLVDTPDFPDAFKPLASNMAKGLEQLRQRNDFHWTYLSPAADFQADGEKTGNYVLAGEEFQTNAAGESKISYADYADAMLDLIQTSDHDHERVSVYQK